MQETFTKEQFWAELEALGEEEVRVRIATHRYGNASDKRALAVEWLQKKERERLIELDRSNREINLGILHTSKSAKNAAWAAAIVAIIATICTVVIAVLSNNHG